MQKFVSGSAGVEWEPKVGGGGQTDEKAPLCVRNGLNLALGDIDKFVPSICFICQ